MEKILNYINGELVEPTNGNYLDNYNPSNGQVYSLLPDSEKTDIKEMMEHNERNYRDTARTSDNLLREVRQVLDGFK